MISQTQSAGYTGLLAIKDGAKYRTFSLARASGKLLRMCSSVGSHSIRGTYPVGRIFFLGPLST